MEALKGYDTTVEFTVPNSVATATFTVKRDGVNVGSPTTATVSDGVASAALPYAAVYIEGQIDVVLSFSDGSANYTLTEHVEVVTPYLEIRAVKAIWPNLSDEQARALESVVRRTIDSHTGQYFGEQTKTLVVNGTGDDALRLPERLVVLQSISTLTTTLDINDSIITGDGWYLKKGWTVGNTYTPTDNLYFGGDDISLPNPNPGEAGYEKPEHGYVIYAPRQIASATPWAIDYPFTITGTWGYDSVPVEVVEAAKLLVNDYGCNEVLYRDRMLKAIKFADSDIDFSSDAWNGSTGNARADQLLAKYVTNNWMIL